jgi:hypothetical protein
MGGPMRHARWRAPAPAEEIAAVTKLAELAAGRADLLASSQTSRGGQPCPGWTPGASSATLEPGHGVGPRTGSTPTATHGGP